MKNKAINDLHLIFLSHNKIYHPFHQTPTFFLVTKMFFQYYVLHSSICHHPLFHLYCFFQFELNWMVLLIDLRTCWFFPSWFIFASWSWLIWNSSTKIYINNLNENLPNFKNSTNWLKYYLLHWNNRTFISFTFIRGNEKIIMIESVKKRRECMLKVNLFFLADTLTPLQV